MSASAEFSRLIALDTIGTAPRTVAIVADQNERTALARRFGLPAITTLEAEAALHRDGQAVIAEGRLRARATQSCVATGADVPAAIDEPFALCFEPEASERIEEIELDERDLDVIPYAGNAIDLGEAIAQEFALALDPFPRAPDADAALRAAGVLSEEDVAEARPENPFAALKGLK